MLKNIILTGICAAGFFMAVAQNNNSSAQAVTKAAQENLATYLSYIPAGGERSYGFSDAEEIKAATAGKPYHIITFAKEFYSSKKLENKDYITVQNEWCIPVMVNGADKVLLTAKLQGEGLEVEDLGGTALAKELQENNANNTATFILRLYPLSADFLVTVTTENDFTNAKYVPLTSAKTAISSLSGRTKENPLTLTEVITLVRQKTNP